MGGARTTVRSVQKGRQRAGTSEQVLGLREGVFRLAQQGPRDPGVGSCGQHEDVAEQREQDQARDGGEQRPGQRVDVEADRAGAGRAVREVAELHAVHREPVRVVLDRRPVPQRHGDSGGEGEPDGEHDAPEDHQRDEHAHQVGELAPGGRVLPVRAGPGHQPRSGGQAGLVRLAIAVLDGLAQHPAQARALRPGAAVDDPGGSHQQRDAGQRDREHGRHARRGQRRAEQQPAHHLVGQQVPGGTPGAGRKALPQRVAVQPQPGRCGVHPTSCMSCPAALTCSVRLASWSRSSAWLATASSASLR